MQVSKSLDYAVRSLTYIAKEKAKLFDRVLDENADFIIQACGGEMKDATAEEKGACFKVLCDLNEIFYI